jgi:hypothetical protein
MRRSGPRERGSVSDRAASRRSSTVRPPRVGVHGSAKKPAGGPVGGMTSTLGPGLQQGGDLPAVGQIEYAALGRKCRCRAPPVYQPARSFRQVSATGPRRVLAVGLLDDEDGLIKPDCDHRATVIWTVQVSPKSIGAPARRPARGTAGTADHPTSTGLRLKCRSPRGHEISVRCMSNRLVAPAIRTQHACPSLTANWAATRHLTGQFHQRAPH